MADEVTVKGLGELVKRMERFGPELGDKMAPIMARIGALVMIRAQKRIHGSRAGNPPELLGIVTGTLRRSILFKVEGDGLSVTIGTRVKYAPIHEFGQLGIRARPFLRPALKDSQKEILELVAQGVEQTLKEL